MTTMLTTDELIREIHKRIKTAGHTHGALYCYDCAILDLALSVLLKVTVEAADRDAKQLALFH